MQPDIVACCGRERTDDQRLEEVVRAADVCAGLQVDIAGGVTNDQTGLEIDPDSVAVVSRIQNRARGPQVDAGVGGHLADEHVATLDLDIRHAARLHPLDVQVRNGLSDAVDRQRVAQLLHIHVTNGAHVEQAGGRQQRANRYGLRANPTARAQDQIAKRADGEAARAKIDDGTAGLDTHVCTGHHVVDVDRACGLHSNAQVGVDGHRARRLQIHVVEYLEGHVLDGVLVTGQVAMREIGRPNLIGGAVVIDLLPPRAVVVVLPGQVQGRCPAEVAVQAVLLRFVLHQERLTSDNGGQLRDSAIGISYVVGDQLVPARRVGKVLETQIDTVLAAALEGIQLVLDADHVRRRGDRENPFLVRRQPLETTAHVQGDWAGHATDLCVVATAVGDQRHVGTDDIGHLGLRSRRRQTEEIGMREQVAVETRRNRVLERVERDGSVVDQCLETRAQVALVELVAG